MSENEINTVVDAINIASSTWKSAFNASNAVACANQYEVDAVMRADPFGIFTGRKEIQAFWQNLIDQGYSDVNYVEPKIEVLNSSSAMLKSGWKMNKAEGVIHKELWVIQADGTAKLREDHFEAKS